MLGETRREKLIDDEMAAKSRSKELTPEQEAELERMKAIGYISGNRSDPANTRMNLGHRYLMQGRVEEAAEMRGLPANTVKTHLPRARAGLAAALGVAAKETA